MKQNRDLRIDFLRGLALITIFIDHIPGTMWEQYTVQNFGFSDAAEAFVLISGISTGLAYGPAFLEGVSLKMALRPWRRAFTLWWVQAVVVLLILAMIALTRNNPAISAMALDRNVTPVLANPVGLLIPLLFFGHQFSCADILPLYIVLMLAAPGILALAVRAPVLLMTASLALWLIVDLWSINLPTWPFQDSWFFDPLAWQVLFVAGILTGIAKRKGRRILPAHALPLLIACMFLLFALLWVQIPSISDWGESMLTSLHDDDGLPLSFTTFNKTFLYLPRALHILALAYVLSALPLLKSLAGSRFAAPFTLLGRNPLPVFATSSVLAYLAQMIRATNLPSDQLDTALIGSGLVIMLLVAKLRDRQRQADTAQTQEMPKVFSQELRLAIPTTFDHSEKLRSRVFVQSVAAGQKPVSPFRRN